MHLLYLEIATMDSYVNPCRVSSLLLTSWMSLGNTNVFCEDGR